MKKAGKIVSYLLVLALVTSLFSGLGVKSKQANAKITAGSFTVLEIVPHKSVATFGYLVDGYFGQGLTKSSDNTEITSIYSSNGALRQYLIDNNLCNNETDKFVSKNFFEEKILKAVSNVDWTVTVNTRTPSTLTESDVNSADLIVINETVPDQLKYKYKWNGSSWVKESTKIINDVTFRTSGYELSTEQVMWIFRKVAGVNGQDPVPYIVDFDLYDGKSFVDVRGVTGDAKFFANSGRFGYERADLEHVLTQGGGDMQGITLGNAGERPGLGSTSTSYKLYKLLSCIDPATLYGLYYTCSDGSFGIDDKLNLFELYPSSNGIPSSYNRGAKLSCWADEFFAPNYLTTSSRDIGNIKTTMGWFEADTNSSEGGNKKLKDPGVFLQTIGGGVGRGIVYNSDSGIFYAVKAVPTVTAANNDIVKIISSFASATAEKNDYHPYRYILVNSTTTTHNRSVIADMVAVANTNGVGLPNGIEVKCMSPEQYANININVSESYDGVFSTEAEVLADFTSILGDKFGVDIVKVPTEYYTNFKPSFTNENGWGSYFGSGDIKIAGNKNYINEDGKETKRYLDFDVRLKGSGSFRIDLYVDVDGDCKFESNEVVNLSEGTSGTFTDSVPLTAFYGEELGKNFVGAFAWRLVISNSGNYVTRDGFSAIRNTNGTNVIKILQVYPTDYSSQYGQDWSQGGHRSSNPTLILPMEGEYGTTDSTKISRLDATSDFDDIRKYFDGRLSVDVATNLDSNYRPSTVTEAQTVTFGTEDNNGEGPKRNHIILDSSLFYYYLEKLEDYSIDVTRYSVYKFNSEVATGKIVYDSKTGKLGKAEGPQKKNLNGSLMYGYDKEAIHYTDDSWQTVMVHWTEGALEKYLVDPCGLIYGERGENDGQVKYYEGSLNGVNGTPICGTSEENEFDIVMLGFGSTMDWMSPKAVNLIKNYLTNNGAAFIGNGAVTMDSNNTLGAAIASTIGMIPSTTAQNGYDFVANKAIPLMVTNDTILSHYPYSVEKYMRASGASKQPLKIKVSGDDAPVVAFVKYNSESGSNHGTWGDAASNYYVYKKGNITFCGFGSTFPKAKIDQVGGIMTLAETLMIVNALVAASRFGSGPAHTDPYMNCIDPDRSVIDAHQMDGSTVTEYHFKDSIYTDFDSQDIANFTKEDNEDDVFNTPIDSTALKPEGFVDSTTLTRWIPYDIKLPTEDSGYVEFLTPDNRALPVRLYKYNKTTKTFTSCSAVSSTQPNVFQIPTPGIYYVGISINPSSYTGISTTSKLGFSIDKDTPANSIDSFAFKINLKDGTASTANLIEDHTVFMIRRVLYFDK